MWEKLMWKLELGVHFKVIYKCRKIGFRVHGLLCIYATPYTWTENHPNRESRSFMKQVKLDCFQLWIDNLPSSSHNFTRLTDRQLGFSVRYQLLFLNSHSLSPLISFASYFIFSHFDPILFSLFISVSQYNHYCLHFLDMYKLLALHLLHRECS